MLCSCGQRGNIKLVRREMPYCRNCFEIYISKSIRHEAGDNPIKLKDEKGYFLDAVSQACALARREIIIDPKGATPGCAEIAAAAKLAAMVQGSEFETVFPKTITLQELQTFFKAERPLKLNSITQEIIKIEERYPGTVNSINKER